MICGLERSGKAFLEEVSLAFLGASVFFLWNTGNILLLHRIAVKDLLREYIKYSILSKVGIQRLLTIIITKSKLIREEFMYINCSLSFISRIILFYFIWFFISWTQLRVRIMRARTHTHTHTHTTPHKENIRSIILVSSVNKQTTEKIVLALATVC